MTHIEGAPGGEPPTGRRPDPAAADPGASRALSESALVDPAHRGRLEVADRVVSTLARRAADSVDGIAHLASTGSMDRALGRSYPRIDVHRSGQHVRLEIDVSVRWPASAAAVASRVQQAVTHDLAHIAGLSVDGVEVSVRDVVRATVPQGSRVR